MANPLSLTLTKNNMYVRLSFPGTQTSHNCLFSCLGRRMAHYQAHCLRQDPNREIGFVFFHWPSWSLGVDTLETQAPGICVGEWRTSNRRTTHQAGSTLPLLLLFPYIYSTKRGHEITDCAQSWKERKLLGTSCERQFPRPDTGHEGMDKILPQVKLK